MSKIIDEFTHLADDVTGGKMSDALEIAHSVGETAERAVDLAKDSFVGRSLSLSVDTASNVLGKVANNVVQLADTVTGGLAGDVIDTAIDTANDIVTYVSNAGEIIATAVDESVGSLIHLADEAYNDQFGAPIQEWVPEYTKAVFDIYNPRLLTMDRPEEPAPIAYNNVTFSQSDVSVDSSKLDPHLSTFSDEADFMIEQQSVDTRNIVSYLQEGRLRETVLRPTPVPSDYEYNKTLTPKDHYLTKHDPTTGLEVRGEHGEALPNTPTIGIKNPTAFERNYKTNAKTREDHRHYDPMTPGDNTHASFGYQSTSGPVNGYRRFQGSTTPAYTEAEPLRKQIQTVEDGLYKYEKSFNEDGTARSLSPIDPFIRLEQPWIAQYANVFSYNRTKTPVADLEWRKGFRHIFITRPECYILARDGALSEQCNNDEVFYTSWTRIPHILYLLSPSYVTCGDAHKDSPRYKDNFNYLLSNRIMGMSALGTEIDQIQSMVKATNQATVTPGGAVSNDYGNSLSLNFRDTKNLEVYECMRLWMRYIHNIYLGNFASSYNDYATNNTYNFTSYSDDNGYIIDSGNGKIPILKQRHLHPYDRALDYCCTIFDIVTNETGTKILYWCKYIGCYPVSAQPSLNTQNMNEAISGEQTCATRFYYQGKEELTNRALIEFNFNAGVVDEMGNPGSTTIKESLPWLLRENYAVSSGAQHRSTAYIGAAGMFTGRPYIVLGKQADHVTKKAAVYSPYLRFMQLQDIDASRMNADITNDTTTTGRLVAVYN